MVMTMLSYLLAIVFVVLMAAGFFTTGVTFLAVGKGLYDRFWLCRRNPKAWTDKERTIVFGIFGIISGVFTYGLYILFETLLHSMP